MSENNVPETNVTEQVETNTVSLANEHVLMPVEAFKEVEESRDKETGVPMFRMDDRTLETQLEEWSHYAVGRGEESKRWFDAVEKAERLRVRQGVFLDAVNRKDGEWSLGVTHQGQRITGTIDDVVAKPSATGTVSGEKAVLRLRYLLGLGQYRTIPLFGSGLWLTIKPVSDEALANLQTLVAMERVKLGRLTTGLALSSTTAYMAKHFLRLVMDHVVDTNIKDNSVDNLADLIKISDLYALSAWVASVIYVKGFVVERPCTKNPSACEYIEKSVLMPWAMVMSDTNKLTDFQRQYMSEGIEKKRTVDEIKAYQAIFSDSKESYRVADVVTVNFQNASMTDYIENATRWIEGIVETVDAFMDDSVSEEFRERQILNRSRLTTSRQYGHLIHAINYTEADGRVVSIKDRDTIDDSLSDLATDDDIMKALMKGVREFIDRTAVTVVCTPKHRCPNCEGPMTEEEKKHPHLIPVDALQLFFILLQHRLGRRQTTSINMI